MPIYILVDFSCSITRTIQVGQIKGEMRWVIGQQRPLGQNLPSNSMNFYSLPFEEEPFEKREDEKGVREVSGGGVPCNLVVDAVRATQTSFQEKQEDSRRPYTPDSIDYSSWHMVLTRQKDIKISETECGTTLQAC